MNPPPKPPSSNNAPRPADNNQDPSSSSVSMLLLATESNETQAHDAPAHSLLRAGASSSPSSSSSSPSPVENVVKGTKATLTSSASYWLQACRSLSNNINTSFQSLTNKVSSLFTSSKQRKLKQLLTQLETLPVQHVKIVVAAPAPVNTNTNTNSTTTSTTVLPDTVVQLAAKRAGVLGHPLRTDRVQDFATALKRWYTRNGFVLHAVTGATLNVDTATAEIAVQEPKTSHTPVDITFCKEMVQDEASGQLMTFKQYRAHHAQRKTFGADKIEKSQLNTTFVPSTTGRTRPSRLASALRLRPNQPFQWDEQGWARILQSKIFSQVLQAKPVQLEDGTIQLQIVATEAPSRHLEYGVGRSLYTGSWEGELDFEHVNVLGGGETLGVSIRRGTKDVEPTARVTFSDSKFGRPGGYDCELFSEYIGEPEPKVDDTATTTATAPSDHVVMIDPILDRKGATFRLHDRLWRQSMASVSLEQTSTKGGRHENIGSSTVSVGPFVKDLPMSARMDVEASVTTGTRVVERVVNTPAHSQEEATQEGLPFSGKALLPFSSVTATTKQIFPLRETAPATTSQPRPLLFALRHSATVATEHLPRHVAKAQGIACSIRGSDTNEEVSSAIRGTLELRIPVNIPIPKMEQDASVVVFGDWLYSNKEKSAPYHWKSSCGLGLRKNVKGFPLKVDFCYTPEASNFRPRFGLGGDFVV